MRNKMAGHGSGEETYEVPEALAKLSVNLASSLNTYILEQYKANMVIQHPETSVNNEIPF